MRNRIKKFWKSLGPGLVTGASDDDPSGIITYSIAGSKFGGAVLWLMLYIWPLMVSVQEMSARIGMSTSCGLAGNIKRYYSKGLLIFISTLIIVSNTFNIGADVFGMASAIDLMLPGSTVIFSWILVILILFLIVKLSYKKIVLIFKWLAFSLFAYAITGFMVIDNWSIVLWKTIIPSFHFTKDYALIIVAVLGTTISPYLSFWQASEEAEEEKIKRGTENKKLICTYKIVTKNELKRMKSDTRIGMAFSNLIGFFIIALTGSVLFGAGINNIETIKEAAEALRPLAGDYAYILFSLGVISSGLLAIPILAGSSAYVLSEIFDWGGGLDKPFSKAKGFYVIIIASTLLGMVIPYMGISPIKALLWTAIIHGIVAPFLISILIHMANNKKIVGPNTNDRKANFWGHLTLAIMTSAIFVFFLFGVDV
jgi:NRAMP (natural resistance-associated macrophage protein)-like metal ion transporter